MEAGRAARVLGRACARGRPPCVGYRRRGGVSTMEQEVVAGPRRRGARDDGERSGGGVLGAGSTGSMSATTEHDVDDRPGARAFFRIGALGKWLGERGPAAVSVGSVKRRRPCPFREHRARHALTRRAASCGRGAAITSTVAAEDEDWVGLERKHDGTPGSAATTATRDRG
jgi:hypothetical protein